nr:MAG TPA: hypothetical protein [Bacteriophage sp.]
MSKIYRSIKAFYGDTTPGPQRPVGCPSRNKVLPIAINL